MVHQEDFSLLRDSVLAGEPPRKPRGGLTLSVVAELGEAADVGTSVLHVVSVDYIPESVPDLLDVFGSVFHDGEVCG